MTRSLYESGGEDAYIREAVALTDSRNRALIRQYVQELGARALRYSTTRAVERSLRRGYDGEIMATVNMGYLLAANEEWEDLDIERLRGLLDDAINSRPIDHSDPDVRAFTATVGLGYPQKEFRPAVDLLAAHPATKRMGSALRAMVASAAEVPKVKRRHFNDYLDSIVGALGIGTGLGMLDYIGYIE